MAEPSDDSIRMTCEGSSSVIGEGVVIDMGTGDGLFAYHCARDNPNKLYIGIDASPGPLEKTSERIHRKPNKGGASNALFIQSAVEDLPADLDGIADEVHVHFPWGSLLRAVATGDAFVLGKLRRLCAPGALLEVIVGIDPRRDRAEIERLGLPSLTIECIDSVLAPKYEDAGFEVTERGMLTAAEWTALRTSWAKRLRGDGGRTVFYIVARASA